MGFKKINYAIIVPLANESEIFGKVVKEFEKVLNELECGKVYFVVDKVSKDDTFQLCEKQAEVDIRFVAVWGEKNRNVVDAYLLGYEIALKNGHEYIIEMDGGLSHDPSAIPMFLRVLKEGNHCAFGSRFINGGSIYDSNWKRTALSKIGTILSNVMLGTRLYDATSGYQGFHSSVVKKFLDYGLRSKAHFYQTEIRYLLRHSRYMEVPIHYRAPSPSVSKNALKNSLATLLFYFMRRVVGEAELIETD